MKDDATKKMKNAKICIAKSVDALLLNLWCSIMGIIATDNNIEMDMYYPNRNGFDIENSFAWKMSSITCFKWSLFSSLRSLSIYLKSFSGNYYWFVSAPFVICREKRRKWSWHRRVVCRHWMRSKHENIVPDAFAAYSKLTSKWYSNICSWNW